MSFRIRKFARTPGLFDPPADTMGSGEDFDGWEGLSELNAFSDHSSDADVGDSFSDGVDFDAIDDAGSLPFGSE